MMITKLKNFALMALLPALIHAARFIFMRHGERINYAVLLAASLTAAIIGTFVNIGLTVLGIDKPLIIIAVGISGYMGGSLIEVVEKGVYATIKRYFRMEKDE